MSEIKPMVLSGQIWKDVHGDYVHVDFFMYDKYLKNYFIDVTRIHDGKFLKLRLENFIKHFTLHNKIDKETKVGTVLTDVYNDFFIIETYLAHEQCYLLRNLKSSLVELFAIDEVSKYFEVYEYDMEG